MDNTFNHFFVRMIALILFILILPLILLILVVVKMTSHGPFLFCQKRLGKNKKPFTLYKIRTMVVDAETLKKKYQYLNETDGPVFKIRHDPRYTIIGKFLSHTGLDELPQLVNIIKGEMAFIGPRPLPLEEARQVPLQFQGRFSVLPGITSLWVVRGAHTLSFHQWMEFDLEYLQKKNMWFDLIIIFKTLQIIIRQILGYLYSLIKHDN